MIEDLDSLEISPPSKSGSDQDEQPKLEASRGSDAEIKQDVKDQKAERQLRKKYAGRAFWFAVGGVAFWAVLLVWSGSSTYYSTKAPFSDNLLIAITTATSINLFAAFLGVIRGLFPTGGKKRKEKPKKKTKKKKVTV